MTTLSADVRIGSQRPRLHNCPLYVSSLGQDKIDLAEYAGLVLDDWQRYVIEETSGRNAQGKYAAFEVGLIVPRQNGKGAIIEADQLGSLFLTKDFQSVYSAHQFKTAKAMFRRIRDLVENCPDLHRMVKAYRQSNEETGIELKNGPRLNFFARSDGSGRGFSAEKMWFDEAYDLSSTLIGDMLPTLSAMRSPQVWYCSSAGKIASDQLARVRKRGIKGDGRLAFYEWSADEGSDLDSDTALYQANPALGIRLDYEFIKGVERPAMDDEEFARERLGIWQGTTTPAVIDPVTWMNLVVSKDDAVDETAYAIDVAYDGNAASIGMAGKRPNGRTVLEFVEGYKVGDRFTAPGGGPHPIYGNDRVESNDWVVDLAERIYRASTPRCFVVDGKSAAAQYILPLRDRGIPVVDVGLREYADACGTIYDGSRSGQIAHLNQPTLNVALAAARKRAVGTEGAWAWGRKNASADITPIVACTLAIHGLSAEVKNAPKQLSQFYAF